MLDAASIFVLLGVLLGGSTGIGLAGAAVHHGLVGMLSVWLLALPTLWVRRAVCWRFGQRGQVPSPTWKATLKHADILKLRPMLLVLATPAGGYAWAHAAHASPALVRGLTPLVVLGLGLWVVFRGGLRWPFQTHRPQIQSAAGSQWTPHALWLILATFWPPPSTSVQELLGKAAEGTSFTADLSSFRWIDDPYGGIRTAFTSARGVLLIRSEDQPNDVFIVRVGLSHDGQPARLVGIYNLSNTAFARESQLSTWRKWVAWTIEHEGSIRSVELADMRGEPVHDSAEWSATRRLQRALGNWQRTGQERGVGRSSILLQDRLASVDLRLSDGRLRAKLPSRELVLELGRTPTPEALGSSVIFAAHPTPRPAAVVPWIVDRLRDVSWIGSERMQWVKGWVFRAGERLEELENQVVGIDPDETIAEELGELLESLPLAEPGTVPGWPPAPIKPHLKPALAAEGRWVTLGEDMLVPGSPGLPSPFVFTFTRTDRDRAYLQTSITLWDPRQVQLNIVAGTEEPVSMTGEFGTGRIPRDPAVLRRLVGAFNGAFQAVHGEFGMMESRRVQLPPKPFAATVATYPDGSAGLGTWPRSAPIPNEMVSLRQNLTPLVAEGKLNPYGRSWWGGVPERWTEETRTVRSGLCLTEEGFLAYFYSPGIAPEDLGKAMLQTRCRYGMHLDMNAGHTGFELYRVESKDQLPVPQRPLDRKWEAKGRVPDVEGLHYFSRLMVRKMPLMNFPRYIDTSARDFFYLTRRSLLPGRPLAPLMLGQEDDGQWRVPELATPNFPPAAALTRLHVPSAAGGEPRMYVITRIDTKQLRSSTPAAADVAIEAPAAEGVGAWLDVAGVVLSEVAPSASARLLARGTRAPTAKTTSALCIDHEGMLVLLRPDLPSRSKVESSQRVAEQARCAQTLYLEMAPTLLLDETLSQARQNPEAEGVRRTWLVREAFTGVRQIFQDTPILPPDKWAFVQRRRVKFVASAQQ